MKLLSVQQAAERSGLAVRTIRHHINATNLKAEKMGRDWFIKESDFKAWLKKERRVGRPATKK